MVMRGLVTAREASRLSRSSRAAPAVAGLASLVPPSAPMGRVRRLASLKRLIPLAALAAVLVGITSPESGARTAACIPVRAVFYESSDWFRLAHGLGANPSPCADYYVTIPALAADKTQMRSGAAWQVRQLGPNFHALAEVSYTGWKRWVTATNNSWYEAGQEVRRRMVGAGFDIPTGDTWVINEFPSTVRSGAGADRQHVRDLVHGLFDGEGGPQLKGMIYDIGIAQTGVVLDQHKAYWESWFQDTAFWNDMNAYVSDFFQENYGDVRAYAVAGVDPATRIATLNQFLQAPLQLALASGAPSSVAAAKAYLTQAYGSLSNASWAWGSAYGWTKVTPDVMADFISAQTSAMRASTPAVRIGFAWNPLNTLGLSNDDYVSQVGAVLERLAGSIHETDGGDPSLACEATHCTSTIDGAKATAAWKTFATWTPTVAAITSTTLTSTAGTPSSAITVQLKTGKSSVPLPAAATVVITSSSPSGTFSTSPSGPWSPTVTLSIPAGQKTASFYSLDATAGSPTITSSLNGQRQSQSIIVAAPTPPPTTTGTTTTTPGTTQAPPEVTVATAALTVTDTNRIHVDLAVAGADGTTPSSRLRLSVMLGDTKVASTVATTGGDGSVSFTAAPQLQRGCYSLKVASVVTPGYAWDGITPDTSYCVTTLPASVRVTAFGMRKGHLHLGLAVVDRSGKPVAASMAVAVTRGTSTFAASHGKAGSDGTFGLTARGEPAKGCYGVRVTSLSAPGITWDKQMPHARFCVR